MAKKQQANELPQFVTVRDVVNALRISKQTVRKLIDAGHLEGKRVGYSIRITRESFDRYIESLEAVA